MKILRVISKALLPALLAGASLLPSVPAGAQGEGAAKCVKGQAGMYPCKGIDLLSHMSFGAAQGGGVADVWGWVDPETGKEYAVLAGAGGVRFVDVSDPKAPV
jgi:hypothetical protein